MAQIDVTPLFTDPDFCDAVSIVSRVPTVNAYGENTLAETTASTVGSVQPASGKTLQRLPEALRVPGVMSFWVRGAIKTDGSGIYPDILTFQGARYQVQVTFPWTNWGGGWTEGTCVTEKPAGA